jgi:iron complex transport system substrate-binding protein
MTVPEHERHRTTRREFTLGGLAALASGSLLLSACGGDDKSSSQDAASGPWTFTDDRGKKVTRETRPKRIVANEATAAALFYAGVKPVGIIAGSPLKQSTLLEGVDPDGVESLGDVYGEINLEKLAAVRPDVIVTAFNPDQAPLLFGFKNEAQQKKAEAFAPILAVNGVKDTTRVIERHHEVAGAFGAHQDAPRITAARKRYDERVAALKEAIEAKPDLAVVAVSGYADQVLFARPEEFPVFREYTAWGLEMTDPKGKDPFWETVSWEQVDKYPADLILYDDKTGTLDLDAMDRKPTWRGLPAVKAGQLVAYSAIEDWSYEQRSGEIDVLTRAVREARPGIAS